MKQIHLHDTVLNTDGEEIAMELPKGAKVIDIISSKYTVTSGSTSLVLVVDPVFTGTEMRRFKIAAIGGTLETHNEDGLLIAVWEYIGIYKPFGTPYFLFENIKS